MSNLMCNNWHPSLPRIILMFWGIMMDFSYNFPISNSAAFGVEVDAYLYYWQTSEGKFRGVVLEVYLLHCCLGRHIEL